MLSERWQEQEKQKLHSRSTYHQHPKPSRYRIVPHVCFHFTFSIFFGIFLLTSIEIIFQK